jgi:thiaminase
VLDIGQQQDWLALQVGMLPCLLGYHVIAKRLDKLQRSRPPQQPNRYSTWINNYIAEDYSAAVETGCGKPARPRLPMILLSLTALIEKHAAKQSPDRMEELAAIFIHATKVPEVGHVQIE